MFRMLRIAYFLSIQISILLIMNTSARIINVPDEYSTIQEGIYASSFGDTVLVHPGIYIENVVIDSVDDICTDTSTKHGLGFEIRSVRGQIALQDHHQWRRSSTSFN